MPTNPIGQGTRNVSLNLPAAARSIIGRLALADDRSIGGFIERFFLKGLESENPKAAAELSEIRRTHRAKVLGMDKQTFAMVGSALLLLLFISTEFLKPNDSIRRAGRNVRVRSVRIIRSRELELA